MNSIQKGHIALIVSGLMFGANYWIAKGTMPAFTPFQIVAVRIGVVALILWIVSLFVSNGKPIESKDMFIIFIAGVLGISANQFFFFAGLEHSTPVETSILHTLSPLLVALFASRLLKERVGFRKWSGIMLGFAGALIIVVSGKTIDLSNLHFKGNMFIIMNIVSYSLYLVIIKPVMEKYNSLQVMKYLFLAGCITFFPLGLFMDVSFSFGHVKTVEWVSLGYVVIVTTLLTYILTLYAMKNVSATITGFYIYMQPFIAAIIGYATGNEHLDAAKLVASLLLFAGVWLVISSPKQKSATENRKM